jgi:hypothetical protein
MTDDVDPTSPRLKVVAEQSDQERTVKFARSDIDFHLRQLAANVIRVVRGAGSSSDLVRQCHKVVECAHAYHEAAGHWPPAFELSEMLRIDEQDVKGSDFWINRHYAKEQMVSGALRLTAGRLVEQKLQEGHGEREMMDGFRSLERLFEESRHQREQEARLARSMVKATANATSKKKGQSKVEPIDL